MPRPPHASRRKLQQPNGRIEKSVCPENMERCPDTQGSSNSQILTPPGRSESNRLLRTGNFPQEDPRSLGGILTAINCADIPSVDPSPRNTELFYFCETSILQSHLNSTDGEIKIARYSLQQWLHLMGKEHHP
jgi:hypothetical protein